MDCQDAKQKLEPCARGLLSAADKAELDRHVATCEGCRLELELTRAVLGSSSSSPEAVDDPAFDETLEPELTIEQELPPQPTLEGPVPPRVLTSQLPEEPEDDLELATLEPSAYDPGAIDLPHPEQGFESASPGPHASSGSSSAGMPSFEEDVSLAELATNPPVLATSPSSGASEVGAKGTTGSGTWDFEPVDMPRTAAPPEGSLTFAKEALDRKRGSSSRGQQRARILLWAGAALGGVGLLGASVWMALAFREPTGSPEPSNLPAVQPPPGFDPVPPVPTDSIAPSVEPAPGLTGADSAAGRVAGSVLKAGAAGAAGNGMPMMPGSKPPVMSAPQLKPAAGASTAPKPGSASSKPPDASAKPAASSAPAAAAFRDDELAPAPPREPRILTVEPNAKPGDPSYGQGEDVNPTPPPKPVPTAPIFVPPSSGSSPGSTGGASGGSAAATNGPLDRLHAATVTAETNADLEALRKLKASWKSAVRSATGGEERSRSKREYADCLWAIQEITKRDPDRKEALLAYREYVLHAPAGGADARTVRRMRHLEDILSDAE